MAILNIRNLPDRVHAMLRVRAARSGRSMEAEARLILTDVLESDRLSPAAAQEWVRDLYKGDLPRNVVEALIDERRREAAAE